MDAFCILVLSKARKTLFIKSCFVEHGERRKAHTSCIPFTLYRRGQKHFMEIKGSQKVHASRQIVFQALLTPEVLKTSIPGCESAEFVDFAGVQQIKLVITTSIPGFSGPYTIYLQPSEVIAPSRVTLLAEPSSSMGSVKSTVVIDLADEGTDTLLNYNANAIREGKVAAVPEFIIKGGVKSALDQFFKNFDKQVNTIKA